MYIGIHVKYPLSLSGFNGTWIFVTDFLKIFKYQISWKSVMWEPSSMWMDRRTDMMKLIVAFCSFAIVPKNVPLKDCEPLTLHNALGQKTKGPQVPANCVNPLPFYMLFFCLCWCRKLLLRHMPILKKKLLIKLGVIFQYGMNVMVVCKKRCCHFWGSLSTW